MAAQNAPILRAEFDPQTKSVELFFGQSFTDKDLKTIQDPNNYFILNVTQSTIEKITGPLEVNLSNPLGNSLVTVPMPAGFTLSPQEEVYLCAKNVTFGEKPIKAMIQGRIKAIPTISGGPTPQPPLSQEPSQARQDSDFYLAGEVTGSSGETAISSIDMKLAIPYVQNFWGKTHLFSPFFDLKANNNPKADPDTMNFGIGWLWPVFSPEAPLDFRSNRKVKSKILSDIFWENTLKVEGNRDFDNVNGIWSSRFTAPLTLHNNKAKLFLDPFWGSEVGYNIASPVIQAQNSTVARIQTGANLYFEVPFAPGLVESISLESSWTRRWPMKPEISFFFDPKDEKLKPLFIGTNPRDYVETKLKFNVNKFFTLYAGHDYGRTPPSFNLVDQRYRLGLVYKFRLNRTPK